MTTATCARRSRISRSRPARHIETDEFRTLNRCLDNAIASAVTEFGYQRDFIIADKQANALNERLGFFAHELRNQLCTATLALSIIKDGNVGLSGATGGVLDRAWSGLGNLIDRSLAEVRMTAGLPVRHHLFSLADFIAEIKLSASLEASVKECTFTVSHVDPMLAVDVDRDLLLAATGNLLQNAFKFTHPHSEVIAERICACRSHPDRREGSLRRFAAGHGGRDVQALHPGLGRSQWPGPGLVHFATQRGGQQRHPECSRSAGFRLRLHHRPAAPCPAGTVPVAGTA